MDSLNQIPDQTIPPSKVHTWILILLVWIAVFSLISVGLLLTKSSSSSSLSNADIPPACQDGTMNALTTNLTRIADACTAGKDGKKDTTPVAPAIIAGTSFDAKDSQGYLPKFTLPSSWTASVFMNNSHEATKPYVSFSATKGISFNCNECGGVSAPTSFFLEANDLGKTPFPGDSQINGTPASMDIKAIEAAYAKNTEQFKSIVVTSEPTNNGTLIHIDGSYEPDGVVAHAGIFHILRFGNTTKIIELTFYEDQGATNAEWLIIKNSLDWSTVK